MSGFVSDMPRSGNGLLPRICVTAAIGVLVFGYDTGVISGALMFPTRDLHAGAFTQQVIVSSLLLGAMLGAVISGYLADAISRKWTTVIAGSVYVIDALGCAFSINAPMLIGFRFPLGISVGTASFAAPPYISEVAPPKVRGGLVSFNQLAVTSGIQQHPEARGGLPGPDRAADLHRLVRHWPRTGVLAHDLGDLPHRDPQPGRVGLHPGQLGRELARRRRPAHPRHLITRQRTFFLYAAIGVWALVFFLTKVPVTKDRTPGQFQDDQNSGGNHPTKEPA